MKLCKDCRFFKRDWLWLPFSKCTRNNVIVINAITGKKSIDEETTFCDGERDMAGRYPNLVACGNKCGPDAAFWKRKGF